MYFKLEGLIDRGERYMQFGEIESGKCLNQKWLVSEQAYSEPWDLNLKMAL